jgi:hypothetical protein
MPAAPWTYRYQRSRRGERLAAALLPLAGLLAPAPAHAGVTIAICSGGGERAVTLPARGSPSPLRDEQQGCAHVLCPRERGQGDPADEDED